MIAHAIVRLYRIWHGVFHLKGAGALLTTMAPSVRDLQDYRLQLPEGQFIEVDFRDVSAMYWLNHLLGDRFEEEGLLAAIKPFLKSGDVVWDIGANSGLLSYNLSNLVELGELHLFEPNPRMSKLAAQAVSPLKHMKVHPFGLSDRNADLILTIPEGHTTMGTLNPEATERNGRECEVTCRAGDEMVFKDGMRPPRVIKIDTEGHELAVIAGLSRTIAEHRPIIFFEHISLDLEKVTSLVPADYSMFTVSDLTGELIAGYAGNRGHNSALLPSV